jgi:predicted dehydrogenase
MDAGEMGRPWRLHAAYGHTGLFNKVGRNHYFFGWLLDPEGNGGGALMDFGCYAVLDALHHLGRPQTVFAREFRLRPAEFPKVDDGATLLLTYPNAMAILEPSWNMPPGTERLEILTHAGYVRMADGKVEVRKGRDPATPLATPSLPPERSDPIGYLVHCIKSGKAVEGVVSLDFNVDVLEILDAAKKSIRSGKAVVLPRQPAPQGK